MIRKLTANDMVLLAAVTLSVLSVLLLATPAAAANNSTSTLNNTTYYDNQTASTGASAWYSGLSNMSLDSLATMGSRTLSYVIGTGQNIPGKGGGLSGPIILGLVLAGVFVGAVAGTQIGLAGGVVVAVVSVFGLISVGVAPAWLKIVLLALVGLIAAAAALRATA